MPERFRHVLDYLPFVTLMAGQPSHQTPIVTRLIETAIMSCVAGGFATYIGVEMLKVEIANIKTAIHQVDDKVGKVDEKIERVRSDLYVPRGH